MSVGNYPDALYGESALIGGGDAKIILNAASVKICVGW